MFEAGKPARIFIVDDHPIIHEGLTRLIGDEPTMTVCGGADSAPAAQASLPDAQPDVVLVDLTLKEGSGLGLIGHIHTRYPRLPILVLSMRDEFVFAERALRAGARGYVMKEAASSSLIGAIKTILKGEIYLSDMMSRTLLQRVAGGKKHLNLSESLTNREIEVFRLLGSGLGTRKIAERLNRSMKTIESHRENIKHKLGCRNAAELVQRAVRWVEQADG